MKIVVFLPKWNSRIALATLAWEIRQKVQPLHFKQHNYSTTHFAEVCKTGCERNRLQGEAVPSLVCLSQQYDPVILCMHKVLLPSKAWSTYVCEAHLHVHALCEPFPQPICSLPWNLAELCNLREVWLVRCSVPWNWFLLQQDWQEDQSLGIKWKELFGFCLLKCFCFPPFFSSISILILNYSIRQ